ncbi:cupin domain-containing protein [Thermohalobacter berrensis]|uniref:XRE family transcriptional regulator n=1 Tax=Thermohalobacter berrensis TaxID=99594 RepID=A0A419T3I8_9FIRM|nr:cupin domain-containing protein [Thermohalobacter berrensis]RKD31948.1 XRE family transcriptional regulator [Thermohalobacter berrensis]
MEINIGSKIRSLRKSMNMSISDLSKKSGISTGLISQIERNMVVPSIESLWKISKGLNVSIGYFFNEKNKVPINPIVRKDQRKKIITANSNAIYELLVPDLNRKIEFLYITIEPGDSTTKELIQHEGEECGIVIKGKLLIKTELKDYILEEGDSIYLDSSTPHRYINIGDKPCISIWAMTPPSF